MSVGDLGDVALVRREIEAALSSRCTIRRATDTAGTVTWAETAVVRCEVAYPRQGGPAAMRDRLGNEPGVIIHLPTTTVVKSGDKVVAETLNGTRSYEVSFVPPLRTTDLLRGVDAVEDRSAGAVA